MSQLRSEFTLESELSSRTLGGNASRRHPDARAETGSIEGGCRIHSRTLRMSGRGAFYASECAAGTNHRSRRTTLHSRGGLIVYPHKGRGRMIEFLVNDLLERRRDVSGTESVEAAEIIESSEE